MKDVIDVYRRISQASRAGRGVRLSLEEALAVTCDGAVRQAIDTADDEKREDQRVRDSSI